jgi:hypothetical protein
LNVNPTSPVFVVGVFRSGTSLLYSLLNQHPQIALMYECDVWDFPRTLAGKRFRGDWLERQEFYNQVLSRHRLIWGKSLRGLENVRTPDDLYRCHSEMKSATLWGEKSPHYGARLNQLARQYPQASFILVWRDPVEIYRSVRAAGKKSAFFSRPGMIHRLIYRHEQMIRQAAQLARAGVRIHHISYDDLVDHTESVCREVCGFLGLEFDANMMKLERADFSAVYDAPQHDHLKRGVIERQKYSNHSLTPAETAKLQRFRGRWHRLSGQRLSKSPESSSVREPSAIERTYHGVMGSTLFAAENIKRLAFEFLPMQWLRTYRQFKCWMQSDTNAGAKISLGQQFRQHSITILASLLLLAGIIYVDYLTGPEIAMGPFYLAPCALLALMVGRGWGTIAVLLTTIMITCVRDGMSPHFHSMSKLALAWNISMRFILFQIFVLLLARIGGDLRRTPDTEQRNPPLE